MARLRLPLASFALVAAVARVLAGCGSNGSAPSSSSAPGSSASGAPATSTASSSTGGAGGAPVGGVGGGSAMSAGPGGDSGVPITYGSPYTGGIYNLGPVDYAETEFHNACAPATKYPAAVQTVEGSLLAGLWSGIPNVANYCDACIWVVTGEGRSALLRVVTYGSTTTNSIDTSSNAYQLLNEGESPRDMTWQFAECPDTGPMIYEFQADSSQYWTSLWVRNARVPLAKVEVQSPNHPSYTELTRGSDGSLTDSAGFGDGTFSIRSTGIDGREVVDTFAWPSAGLGDAMLTGKANFE